MSTVAGELDVLIVGSGVAGLSTALALGGRRRVAIFSKEAPGGGSTALAQGGIAAAISPEDSAAEHAADTISAAAGLGDPDVAQIVTSKAAEAVQTLAKLGVEFDVGALAREGGHSAPRVVHARGDATGAEVSRALLEAARRRGIPMTGGAFLVDLLITADGSRVVGALFWDVERRSFQPVRASTVVLATGGYGQLWASTTSSPACTGDGLAAAMRAGAQVADLEFVQFHPTGLLLGKDPTPLATEALRGAGARLRDATGELLSPVTANGAGDLAPRDVVSRAMARRMAELDEGHCYLDATMLGRETLERRFPTFTASCRASGIDPVLDWAPVAPTTHYTMGGILTGSDGRTTLEGLMAVGEVACSGLHGANRLASNSLLEGAVMGGRAAAALLESPGPALPRQPVAADDIIAAPAAAGSRHGQSGLGRSALRSAMQQFAGVARDRAGLDRLGDLLSAAVPPEGSVAAGLEGGPELANMRLVARAVAAAAGRREESRGAHWRTDFPDDDPGWRVRQVLSLLPGDELAVGDLSVVRVGRVGRQAAPTGPLATSR